MYQYRFGQPEDLPWLDQASAAGALETLSPEQRQWVAPPQAAMQGQVQLRQTLASPASLVILALAGGQPVGFLLLVVAPDTSTDEPVAMVIDLWVDPVHRRRKLATTMLAAAEEVAARHGLRKLKLWTGLHNTAALQLAQLRGYIPAGRIGVKDLVTAAVPVT